MLSHARRQCFLPLGLRCSGHSPSDVLFHPEYYKQTLLAAGFSDVKMVPITDHVALWWHPHGRGVLVNNPIDEVFGVETGASKKLVKHYAEHMAPGAMQWIASHCAYYQIIATK